MPGGVWPFKWRPNSPFCATPPESAQAFGQKPFWPTGGKATMATKPNLDEVVSALERLVRLFDWERKLYLAFGLVSLFLFLFSGYRMLSGGNVDKELLAGMLGSTGVAAACSARVVFFLTKAFSIVEQLVTPKAGEGGDANGK
jgi:uncharacterized membrane protein YtjA (UPF0391 family)